MRAMREQCSATVPDMSKAGLAGYAPRGAAARPGKAAAFRVRHVVRGVPLAHILVVVLRRSKASRIALKFRQPVGPQSAFLLLLFGN